MTRDAPRRTRRSAADRAGWPRPGTSAAAPRTRNPPPACPPPSALLAGLPATCREPSHRRAPRVKRDTMETPTQTALVLAAQAGDRMAFETLVGAYRRELVVHCYRMLGSLHDAEDLVQETLLRVWEKRATLTKPASYRAWSYRIATNLCLNYLTRVPRRSLPP